MPTILNCLDKDQVTVMGGSHFSFKAGQLKYFSDKHIARQIARLRADEGFVELPEEMDHLALLKPDQFEKVVTAEERETIAKAKKEGVEAYCRKLRMLIYNATVSLQRDLDRANLKYDARIEANDKDLERMKELAKYQKSKSDLDQSRIDQIKELEKQIGTINKG